MFMERVLVMSHILRIVFEKTDSVPLMIVSHEAIGWIKGVRGVLEVPIGPEGLLTSNRHLLLLGEFLFL